MRSRTGILLVPLALSLLCTAQVASSQTGVQVTSSAAGSAAPGSTTPVEVGSGRYAYGVAMYNTQPIAGKPYAAEITATTIKTLPGGTTITQPNTTEKVWRDSQGRTRSERRIGTQLTPGAPPPPTVVEIRDPVAGIGYVLDQSAQTAYRVQMAQRPTPSPAVLQAAQAAAGVLSVPAPATATVRGVEIKREMLGTQLIEGVEVTGMRTTTVYPVNYSGNDRPITAVMENWSSTALGVVVLTKRNDPRSGDYTSKYTNISLVNPDFSLFQLPAGYQVVDVVGPMVTIRLN
jgi:hypothetical protein